MATLIPTRSHDAVLECMDFGLAFVLCLALTAAYSCVTMKIT